MLISRSVTLFEQELLLFTLLINNKLNQRVTTMAKNSVFKTGLLFISLVVLVIGLSTISSRIWGGKPEGLPERHELVIEKDMTISQFGKANDFPNPVLKSVFELKTKSELDKKLTEYGTTEEVTVIVDEKLALAFEQASKNWIKILAKFILWFSFMVGVFILRRKRKITANTRKLLLFAAVLTFGVILGSDPNPMGTVKDAIHLFATEHVIFPPRMIAMIVFLAAVFFANKYICSWGCQLGTLQDLIFRINRTGKHKAVIGRQIKLPFVLTNTIRVLSLLVFTVVAFAWGLDLGELIDPFRVFKPVYLGIAGGIFAAIVLIISLFVYRPWCHLFCPFGLVGWIVEKISLNKIRVDYDKCIACGKCEKACPSTAMSAILKQDKKTIPDCFSCDSCREACPTDAISFSCGKRTRPPADLFDKTK